MLGLETALAVVATTMVAEGPFGWDDVARVMSTTPARIAGLGGTAGRSRWGSGQPRARRPHGRVTVDRDASRSMSRNNPWHGRTLTGAVRATVLRGVVTHRA